MNEITKVDFYNFLYTQNIITDLIEEKTKELSMILYNRLPIGEMCEVSIEESWFESDCIFVEFEEYRCGESSLDQFNLPMRFLWDSEYPAIYKKENDLKNELLKGMEEIDKRNEKLKKDIQLEEFEKEEYKRLKVKYEIFDIGLTEYEDTRVIYVNGECMTVSEFHIIKC